MIKIGSTIPVNYGKISQMWLVKDQGLKKLADSYPELKGKHYKVLGFEKGKGWWTLNNGTLSDMRAFIEGAKA